MKFSTLISTINVAVVCLILVYNVTLNDASMELISETIPTNLEIPIGSMANITCVMNLRTFKGKNSSSLFFIQEDTGQRVPQTDIAIVNRYTIVYMIRNASEQNRNYICKSDDDGVGTTHVAVGTAPLHVDDFKCRGYDFLYMECSFTLPNNTITPIYQLHFTVINPDYIQACELKLIDTKAICNLTEDNFYRNGYQFYNFTLRAHNSLGIMEQNIMVDHYKSVVPASPDFKVENIQINSADLVWQMRNYYLYRRKSKLQYKVRLHPHNFDWLNYNQYNLTRVRDQFSLELNKLPYAYYNYTVSLRLRVNASAGDGNMWSPAVIHTFRTKPCLPKAAPKTTVGSFYINSTATHVRLYWQKLHAYEENGPNFNYVIKEVQSNGVKIDLKPIEIDRTSALFEWHNKNHYKFILKSRNSEGVSLTSSEIIVPRIQNPILKDISPEWVWGTYISDNHTYTLTWKPPANIDNLEDYTVFWCSGKINTKTECRNNIEFEHVKKTNTKYMKTMRKDDHKLNFAVSANYKDTVTTGMHWASCSPDVSSDLDTMTPKIIALSATSINVEWTWDNICPSILEGYNITYCQVENAIGTTTTVLINNTAKSYELQNLKPYTQYKITMYMYSKKKVGQISEAQLIRTKEEAPTPPRYLTYHNVTSNSVWLTWAAPAVINGNLRFYKIIYNNEYHVINCTALAALCSTKAGKGLIKFQLAVLSSYTTYNISIIAGTVGESQPSEVLNFTTLIGRPSNPLHLTINQNDQLIEWNRPEVPSGRLEFYEVMVTLYNNNNPIMQRISAVFNSTNCIVNLPPCTDGNHKFEIRVRAVNAVRRDNEIDYQIFTANTSISNNSFIKVNEVAEQLQQRNYDDLKCIVPAFAENEHESLASKYRNETAYGLYKSVWEAGAIIHCSLENNKSLLYISSSVLLSLIILALFSICIICMYKKCREMQDIKAILPPGIANLNYMERMDNNDEYSNIKQQQQKELQQQKHLIAQNNKDFLQNCEYFRLLSQSSSDSGVDVNGFTNNSVNIFQTDKQYDIDISKHVDYVDLMHTDNYIEHDALANTLKQNAAAALAPNNYMIMEKPKITASEKLYPNTISLASSVQHSFDSTMPTSDGYILSTLKENSAEIKNTSNSYMHHLSFDDTNSYVKPSDIPLCDSGYLLSSQVLEKPRLNSSYTSFDMLSKPLISMHKSKSSPSSSLVLDSTLSPISGYVTQKELSVLGHQNQYYNQHLKS